MMMICFAIIFGWQIFVDQVLSPRFNWKRPGQATTQPAATTAPATIPVATTDPATAPIAAAPATTPGAELTAAPPAPLRVIEPATQPTTITLGDQAVHRMIVRLSSTGAGVESVTLPDFRAPDGKSDYTFQVPHDPGNPNTRPLATRSITVNGNRVDLVGENWHLESQTSDSATFALDLGLVRVRKIYELSDRESPGKGYQMIVRHTIENRTPQPANVTLGFAGPTTPPRENVSGPDQQVLAGYDDGYQRAAVTHHYLEELTTAKPELDLTRGADDMPLLWGGASSVYFEAILRPVPLEGAGVAPAYIARHVATAMKPDAKEATDRQVMLSFLTSELPVQPGQTLTLDSEAFFGPRWRKVLNDPHFAAFPRDYDATLVLTAGPCGWCTFHWLINGLVALLNFFQWVFGGFAGNGDWGLAIIALVVLVRTILHPITKRSQISMMRMGKMGPEMERLKKKYGEDKDELNKQMMLLYKEQGIGPYLGCLPMFLQMPIWIALWSALQTTFELRQAEFLWGWTWIDDLSKPDGLLRFARPPQFWLPLLGDVRLTGFNILPLLMGVVFYLQMKLTPQPPSTTPEQEMQKKMMLWMSVLLFPLFLYNGPSGLNLYILTSTTIGIVESKRIRKHIKEREEAEKAGKIMVDAPRGMKKEAGGAPAKKPKAAPAPKKTGFAGLIQQMQAKAEEIRRQANKDRK